jgi:hypothetical protein
MNKLFVAIKTKEGHETVIDFSKVIEFFYDSKEEQITLIFDIDDGFTGTITPLDVSKMHYTLILDVTPQEYERIKSVLKIL